MQKINVMQVMPEFGLAGAETMCEALAYELLKTQQVDLTVVSLYDFHSAITDRMESAGIRVIFLGKRNGLDLSVVGKLAKLMKQYRIDVVHTHRYVMQYAIPAAMLAGVPGRVHTVHSIASKEVESGRRKLAKVFYRFCHVIPVAISPLVRETVEQEYSLPAEKIPVVYNGSDISKCWVKHDYDANTPFRFLHIGRMLALKNQHMIIRSVKALLEQGVAVQVEFIGGGEKEEEYRELVRTLQLEDYVIFHGLQADVYPFLHSADAFLLPSVYEGMPITLLEAMGTGLPIIATAVGGVPDMIQHELNGLLIQPEPEELTAAMKQIVEDRQLRERLGRQAQVDAHMFSSAVMSDSYMDVYRIALKTEF